MTGTFGVPDPAPQTPQAWAPGPHPPAWGVAYAPPPRESLDVAAEAGRAVLVIVLLTLVGAPLGLLWAALRPHIDPYVVSQAAESALTPQFTADMTLAAIGLGAGLVAGALAWLLARGRGLGTALGLAAGGVLAMLVAARTGLLAAHPDQLYAQTNAVLAKHDEGLISPSMSKDFLDLLRFRLRAHAVLLVMTFSGPLAFGALTAFRDRGDVSFGRRASWGSADTSSTPELAQLSGWSAAPAPAAAAPAPPGADRRW